MEWPKLTMMFVAASTLMLNSVGMRITSYKKNTVVMVMQPISSEVVAHRCFGDFIRLVRMEMVAVSAAKVIQNHGGTYRGVCV
jgi:hypothetical protein